MMMMMKYVVAVANIKDPAKYRAQIEYNYQHRYDQPGYAEAIEWVASLFAPGADETVFDKAVQAVEETYAQGINTICADASVFYVDGKHRC